VSSQIKDAISRIDPRFRLFLGASLLLTSAFNNLFYTAMIQLLIAVLFLLILVSGRRLFTESIRLLCWLVIPILLLHAFFTPGEMLFKGVAIPVTVEGIRLGSWFALHLVVMFLSALVLSRLLSKQEWITTMLSIPGWGEKLVPYALLLESGLKKNGEIVRREYANWCSHGKKLKQFPLHITTALTDSLNKNRDDAFELWNDWDACVSSVAESSQPGEQGRPVETVLAVMIAAIIWMLYLAGSV